MVLQIVLASLVLFDVKWLLLVAIISSERQELFPSSLGWICHKYIITSMLLQ